MSSPSGTLLIYYVDPGEAAETGNRLRQAGIEIEVASVDPHNIKPSRSDTRRVGLWVVHDDQFEDAVALLQNPEHVPRRVISIDETAMATRTPSSRKIIAIVITGIGLLGTFVYFFADASSL